MGAGGEGGAAGVGGGMKDVFGIPISQRPVYGLLHRLVQLVDIDCGATTVCLVNTFSLVEASRNPTHMASLKAADLCLPDGWPVARLARTQRIAGADLMLAAARHPTIQRMRHTLYGGFGVAFDAAVRQWRETGSSLAIVPPWVPEDRAVDEGIATINATRPDFLWVALGCPKQEAWMLSHRDALNAKVIIGVGAAFNYLAGRVRRAPAWMQRVGLEGVYRIKAERHRWRRQVGAGVGLVRLLLRGAR